MKSTIPFLSPIKRNTNRITLVTILLGSSFLFFNCGLDDRYPPKGSFCDIMERPAPCMDVNFREKFIVLNEETIPLNMKTRVEYNFVYNNKNYELGVLGEHRYYIKEMGIENAKEKVFHRRKK